MRLHHITKPKMYGSHKRCDPDSDCGIRPQGPIEPATITHNINMTLMRTTDINRVLTNTMLQIRFPEKLTENVARTRPIG